MVPGGRLIIAIGYGYYVRKVISFIVTDRAGNTKESVFYLSNYFEQFYDVSIHPVDRLIVMYKFFGSVNEVDSHNKSRQSNLAVENFRVNQCGCLRLCTPVAMGTSINN